MSWTKFGDEYPVEAAELTDAEWRTHGEALMWSNWRLLDFRIPKKDVRRFAEYRTDIPLELVTAGLVAKRWWRDDGDEWYIGLRFPEWQRDSDEVLAERARATARQKRHRRHKNGDHSLCTPDTCEDAPSRRDTPRDVQANRHRDARRESRDPVPTRPDPVSSLRTDRCKLLFWFLR
ncbi:MAG: hypothetical protein ACRDPY_15220 [Streptosporangiaceae bacterium]